MTKKINQIHSLKSGMKVRLLGLDGRIIRRNKGIPESYRVRINKFGKEATTYMDGHIKYMELR